MQIQMDKAQVGVVSGPDGSKLIVAQDVQSGVQVVIPLTDEGAKVVARGLTSGLVLAHGVPPQRPS